MTRIEHDAEARPREAAGDVPTVPGEAERSELTSADYSVAFSPVSVAVGLAVVAGVVAALAARRRRRRRTDRPHCRGTEDG